MRKPEPDAIVIDAIAACKAEKTYDVTLHANALTRLVELQIEPIESVSVKARFFRNVANKPFVKLSVEGEFSIICQRCFCPMEFPLSVERELVLLVSEAQNEQDFAPDHEPVWLEGGSQFLLTSVVEDEVLLSIPASPMHPVEICALNDVSKSYYKEHQTQSVNESTTKVDSPFAILEQLKQNKTH